MSQPVASVVVATAFYVIEQWVARASSVFFLVPFFSEVERIHITAATVLRKRVKGGRVVCCYRGLVSLPSVGQILL